MAAFRIRDQRKPLWPLVIVGLLGIAAGIVAFIWPDITAWSLLLLIAAWALVMGAFQIASAITIRKSINNEWPLGLSGIISMIFGVVMIAYPRAGALAVAWTIGTFAIPFGLLLIMLGFRFRRYTMCRNPEPVIFRNGKIKTAGSWASPALTISKGDKYAK